MTDFDPLKFWRDPEKAEVPELERSVYACKPEYYLDLDNVSALVVDVMTRYAQKDWAILEIGCGTGRNLVALQAAGFANVAGIELSRKAVSVGRKQWPEYKEIPVKIGPAEKAIHELDDFDVIFTQGCLMHIPDESLLEVIARKAKRLILTCEAELSRRESIHVWRRDYQQVFEALGWKQVEWEVANKYPPLPKHTIKRVFVRK